MDLWQSHSSLSGLAQPPVHYLPPPFFYSMQVFGEAIQASRVVLVLFLERREGGGILESLPRSFCAQMSTLTKSEVNGSPRCAVRQENTVEDANSRDGVAEVVQYYQEEPALSLVRSQADKQVLHHQES